MSSTLHLLDTLRWPAVHPVALISFLILFSLAESERESDWDGSSLQHCFSPAWLLQAFVMVKVQEEALQWSCFDWLLP